MTLKLELVGFSDLERLIQIEVAALKALEIFPFLYPDGIDASRQQAMLSETMRTLAYDTTVRYMKVIDPKERDKTVAFAKWHLPGKLLADLMSTTTHSSPTKHQPTTATPAEGAPALAHLLSAQSLKLRQRIMNKNPHCCTLPLLSHLPDPHLRTLSPSQARHRSTHQHQHQDATALLREMCRAADSRQLPSYLDASPVWYELYEQFGFVEVGTITVNLRPFGGMGDYVLRNMVRPAR